ncbi:CHAT domain-containing protein [Micromonospora sp. NPDC048898]|uniref:CHAT domain-containing protein n=1 Tax=Micromonospora sp. NPDC048898 TaxID=3364260 RepID=UPI00371D0A05
MGRRPPRTSYGYLAPPEARVLGWECNNDGCGTGDRPAPPSWPYPCRECRRPADATFDEPWAHEARGYKIQHSLHSADRYVREMARLEQHVWAYKEACFRDDRRAADRAWRAYRRARPPRWPEADGFWMTTTSMFEMVRLAAAFADLDPAMDDVLECYPLVDTRDVDDDNTRRTISRTFVSMCIVLLECPSSIGHPREAELHDAMRDVAGRIEGVLIHQQHEGLRRVAEIRALDGTRATIVRSRRSSAVALAGLPSVSSALAFGAGPRVPDDPYDIPAGSDLDPRRAVTLADAAITIAEIHDDTGPLDELVRHLDRAGTSSGLTQLLRGRRQVVVGDLDAAVGELERGVRADDRLARRLRPQLLATIGLLLVRIDANDLEVGIERCRAGRRAGLRWWRRTTPADPGLARLLLWRALRPETPSGQASDDVHEAVRLIRRRCRRHRHDADDQLLLQEAGVARDALAGRPDDEQRHRAWRDTVNGGWSTPARARLAAAWAQWAAGTGVSEFAAEAYQQLVALAAQDAAARYGARAKRRVLAAAQEYAEEAGYWLARTGRYREAVLALESGRAVGLTEVLGRDNTAVIDRLFAAGRADLADEYGRAIEEFDERERQPSAELRPAWAHLRGVAQRVAAVTGADPLVLAVDYDDVIAETGDGALVYLAAAKAGGYALVVAARHDPQYVDLPKLDRATVAGLVGRLLPETEATTGLRRFATSDEKPAGVRDLSAFGQTSANPMTEALHTLWAGGVRDVVLFRARGRIVTLVPVGLLNLLPLHAAGEPDAPDDVATGRRHVGQFSAIRYAPNARALRRCRDVARELAGQEQRLLVLDVPDGHGVDPRGHLRYVARETTEIVRRWTGRPTAPSHACTWEEFRAAADEHTVWHLACHGSAEPGSILDSRLYFADRQVTLEELRRALVPGRRRLAVLSACDTNVSGFALPNEVVGLPSALIQLGFAGVIATAWAVDDLATTYLMTAFYHLWCREGDEPAVALSRAQQWLRTATRADLTALLPDVEPSGAPGDHPYTDPEYWAAFAYTGA